MRSSIETLILASALAFLLGACAGPTPYVPSRGRLDEAQHCELLSGHEATFVLWDSVERRLTMCDLGRASEPLSPASTFKIANALISLEEGVVADVDELVAWDGVDRGRPAWNADANLRSGMRWSTVWLYQEMARRVGYERMGAWLDTLQYGNADIGPPEDVDRFWLGGTLRISALEQVGFLARLADRELPVSLPVQDAVAEILLRESSEDGQVRLFAKTGALLSADAGATSPDDPEPTGWYVGWVDVEGVGRYVFAFNMRLGSEDDLPDRERLAKLMLESNGVPLP